MFILHNKYLLNVIIHLAEYKQIKKKPQNTIDIAINCDDISQHRVAAASAA